MPSRRSQRSRPTTPAAGPVRGVWPGGGASDRSAPGSTAGPDSRRVGGELLHEQRSGPAERVRVELLQHAVDEPLVHLQRLRLLERADRRCPGGGDRARRGEDQPVGAVRDLGSRATSNTRTPPASATTRRSGSGWACGPRAQTSPSTSRTRPRSRTTSGSRSTRTGSRRQPWIRMSVSGGSSPRASSRSMRYPVTGQYHAWSVILPAISGSVPLYSSASSSNVNV